MAQTDSIMTSLMNYLYTALTDGEKEFVERNEQERFIVWCLPGIPFEPTDLRFARRGIVGEGATPEAKAEDTAMLIGQASRFARLVDFVPDVTGIFNEEQQLVAFHRNENTLSSVYERTLTQSEVAATELTEKQRERIDRFRNLLYPEQKGEDLITGEVTTKRVEGPVMKAYKEHLAKFEAALLEYNRSRVKALAAATQQDVLDFSLNQSALRQRVRLAGDEWASAGHKNDVDQMQAFIDQVTQRDLSLWKADLLDRIDKSRIADGFGQDFLLTFPIPGGFAETEQGWSSFEFSSREVEQHSKGKSTQFGAEAKGGWGPLSFGGGASGSTERKHEVQDVTNLSMSFAVAQIPLSRAWFDPTFLQSRAWRLSPSAVEVSALSDGQTPPKGSLVAYPTSVIFMRNIRINFDELHDEKSELRKHLEAGGKAGYGPFKLGGNYKRDDEERQLKSSVQKDGLTVQGLQILGFRCHLLKRAPNPLETITEFK